VVLASPYNPIFTANSVEIHGVLGCAALEALETRDNETSFVILTEFEFAL